MDWTQKIKKTNNLKQLKMSLQITDANFQQTINSNKVVVVDFTASWCGPCKAISPIIDQLANEFQGKAIVGKLDVDQNKSTTAKFGIRNIPAILFFQNGQVVHKELGSGNKSAMASRINSLL